MVLADIIINRIRKEGPISFRDFMEMALYYPGLGYYTSKNDIIGLKGDFYTSSTVTPVFGALIGKQIEEMWDITGEKEFTIVEYGAGTGKLCRDILSYFRNNTSRYNLLKYCIIEKSPVMQQTEKENVAGKVQWHDSIAELAGLTGCVLSNELVDTFAVHRVVMQDKLMEVFVDYNNGFEEVLKPAGTELTDYLAELRVELSPGYKTEINLNARHWMKEIAGVLTKGYVLTIDYGYPSVELYGEHKNEGTLTCFYNHTINKQPYRNIGEQDITSHVNFSALCLWGYNYGLEYGGYTDQANFLLALGFRDYVKKMAKPGDDVGNFKKEMLLTKTLVEDMGSKFKVLVQHKGVPPQRITGLK